MNFFKTSTLVPPVIWWSLETKTFRWDVQQRGRRLQPLGCFLISKFKSVSCSGKARVKVPVVVKTSRVLWVSLQRKKHFLKTAFLGPKVWVAIFGLLHLPCLNLWTYQHILPQICLIQVIFVARSTDTCARSTELTCKCLMCAGYLATCSKFDVPARPLNARATKNRRIAYDVGRISDPTFILNPTTHSTGTGTCSTPRSVHSGHGSQKAGPKTSKFFPLKSPPSSILRRQCSIYTREGYLVNRIFWLGTLQISFRKIALSDSFRNNAIEFRTPKFETSINSKGHLWDWNKCIFVKYHHLSTGRIIPLFCLGAF